ncbi:Nitrogen permease reactivator protein [Bulinus truncatus]|nr:Nitrogen permease reactivator protein [Bulinus truncatus]
MLYAPIGNYRDMVVAVKHVRWTQIQLGEKEMIQDLKMVKELSHDNINQFIGACVSPTPGATYVLFRYCSKGSLQDVLENDDIKLDWMFKLSFALDLARGMEYLHKTTLRSHGNLKSSNCVIDSRWVLKITDFGAVVSYKKPHTEGDPGNRAYYSSLLWCAPEILRMSKRPQKGTQKGDVYSFGIILQEILLRCGPYLYNNKDPAEIISLVKSKGHSRPPYRPTLPNENDCPAKATSLMVICWSEEPEARPDFHNIRKRLREFNGHKRFNIMDNMLQMLESYSSNLEVLVNERTEELEAEKRKTDTLLYQMLPPFTRSQSTVKPLTLDQVLTSGSKQLTCNNELVLVAEQLKSGMCVIPEYYDHVSIFFSDIVGFTAIASQSKPLEVVDLLNDLYTCFDEVIARRDVYKVETIGDAYMCVSGCPKRNGPRHAGEIANMALDLISAVTHFRIRHKPEETLNLRVGLHTGPCAAGVVGRTMPRYCLFGDTVNMASRMESTGKALHIHMSHEMKEALDDLDWGFLMVDRGFIEVKGKGLHKTFWLVGKKNYKKPLPESLVALQKKLEDGDNPPTPSYCTLTVGDSMFSALRKTSITISNITVENTPYTSDSEDAPGAHHVNAPDAAGRGGESGLRSASATMSSVPKRRYATVQPANLVISTEENGKEGRRTKNGRHADSEISDGGGAIGCDSPTLGEIVTADSQDREKYSPVRQPIKKDSACYSLTDVNGDHHEANKTSSEITTSRDSVTDLTKLDTSLTVISSDHRSVFGDSELRDSPEDPAATTATNRNRESRKKYWERRAEKVGHRFLLLPPFPSDTGSCFFHPSLQTQVPASSTLPFRHRFLLLPPFPSDTGSCFFHPSLQTQVPASSTLPFRHRFLLLPPFPSDTGSCFFHPSLQTQVPASSTLPFRHRFLLLPPFPSDTGSCFFHPSLQTQVPASSTLPFRHRFLLLPPFPSDTGSCFFHPSLQTQVPASSTLPFRHRFLLLPPFPSDTGSCFFHPSPLPTTHTCIAPPTPISRHIT